MENSDLLLAIQLEPESGRFESAIERNPKEVGLESQSRNARRVLEKVLKFRRMVKTEECCGASYCESCSSQHLQKITSAMTNKMPITFVLPAFPGKSPNPAKVLGVLPDMAEQKALQFLDHLCLQIQCIYEPGAQISICSDGRVFSDVVGIPDSDVTAYQNELGQMIERLNLKNVSVFNLDGFCQGKSFDHIRGALMHEYGQSIEVLRDRVRRGSRNSCNAEDREAHRMYCGITRSLFEDALTPDRSKSRTAIQNSSRILAYEVIRRSNAWSELIRDVFPNAVRLSIHPQACGSKKLGIQLLGTETWLTPWHGVAVETDGEFVLMKRVEAEKLNAKLIKDHQGRASHYKLHINS